MIIAISGSREYPEPQDVIQFLYGLATQAPDTILTCGGRGVIDQTAEKYARTVGLDVISFRPVEVSPTHYEMVTYAYGDRAEEHVTRRKLREVDAVLPSFAQCCWFRNMYIVGESDRLVAFWDGQSPGTKNAIGLARAKDIPISRKSPGMPMVLEHMPSAKGGAA